MGAIVRDILILLGLCLILATARRSTTPRYRRAEYSHWFDIYRAEIKACELPYMKDCVITTGRLGRRSPGHVMNVSLSLLQTIGYNETIFMRILELRSNKYEKSVVDFESPSCDAVNNRAMWFFLDQLSRDDNLPIECPSTPKNFTITNFVFDPVYFPADVFRFSPRILVHVGFMSSETRKVFLEAWVYAEIKIEVVTRRKAKH